MISLLLAAVLPLNMSREHLVPDPPQVTRDVIPVYLEHQKDYNKSLRLLGEDPDEFYSHLLDEDVIQEEAPSITDAMTAKGRSVFRIPQHDGKVRTPEHLKAWRVTMNNGDVLHIYSVCGNISVTRSKKKFKNVSYTYPKKDVIVPVTFTEVPVAPVSVTSGSSPVVESAPLYHSSSAVVDFAPAPFFLGLACRNGSNAYGVCH